MTTIYGLYELRGRNSRSRRAEDSWRSFGDNLRAAGYEVLGPIEPLPVPATILVRKQFNNEPSEQLLELQVNVSAAAKVTGIKYTKIAAYLGE